MTLIRLSFLMALSSLSSQHNQGAETVFLPGGSDLLKNYVHGENCYTAQEARVFIGPNRQNDHFTLTFFCKFCRHPLSLGSGPTQPLSILRGWRRHCLRFSEGGEWGRTITPLNPPLCFPNKLNLTAMWS